MIFVDANVFILFVGYEHPHRDRARDFLEGAAEREQGLVTSSEVLQEILHYYRRRGGAQSMDAAFDLVDRTVSEVWPVERADIERARSLAHSYPGLEARDLVHLACCIRRKPRDLVTFDRALAAAWDSSRA